MTDAVHSFMHKDCLIEIHHDSSPSNPWEDWDCQPPMLVREDSPHITKYGTEAGDLHAPLDRIPLTMISRHWRTIAGALGLTEDSATEEATAIRKSQGVSMADARLEVFGDALDYLRRYRNASDYLDSLAALWTLAGCVVLRQTSTGYVQSAWADLLLVYTPQHERNCGGKLTKAEKLESLKADAKLWGQWAWGDCYGYTVTPDADMIGEDEESCWGFFGDWDDEYMIGEAKAIADGMVKRHAARMAEELAEVIQDLRPDLLPAYL